MKYIFTILFIFNIVYAQNIEHFLLPQDGDKAEKSLILDIENAKNTIDVAMFMVTNKKLTNALKRRAKKGNIHIRLIADKRYDIKTKISKVKNLVNKKNISIFHLNGLKKKKGKLGILHSKLVLIDDTITYIGSTNWTYSAFKSNYEILVKFTDNTTSKLYHYYFSDMLRNAIPYK